MKKDQSEKTIMSKVTTIISAIALCVWLLFEVLERTISLSYANYVIYVAIGVISISEAVSFWNVKRVVSYIGIGGLLCTIALIILEAM